MVSVTAYVAGLEVQGVYEYEAPTGPTYACGGTPGGVDVDTHTLDVDDNTDGAEWYEALAESVGPASARVALGYARVRGTLPRVASDWLLSHYEEEIMDALCEAGQDWEPEYEEY